MQLDRHLESVRNGINQAAALADEHSQQVAARLADALESSVRLALIEALSEASTEISADLAPGSVDFHLADGEPQFVVTPPPAPTPEPEPEPETAYTPSDEDEEQVRVTLRLPASVKKTVDERADADGVSTNTWLLQLVLRELGRGRGRNRQGIDAFINDTVESAMQGAFGGFSDWGHRGPAAQAPPPPTPPPFPPGFPFHDTRDNQSGRGRTRRVKGWAQ